MSMGLKLYLRIYTICLLLSRLTQGEPASRGSPCFRLLRIDRVSGQCGALGAGTIGPAVHWIMGDGYKDRNGLVLCANSFTIKDTVRLINVLIIRYNLDCTFRFIHKREPLIYIRTKSIPLLRSIVLPYMHESMLYKLNL
jgi:hypothetical protein